MDRKQQTERQRQASQPRAFDWLVYPAFAYRGGVPVVQCRATTESGAFCVAEAEHPGVQFMSARATKTT